MLKSLKLRLRILSGLLIALALCMTLIGSAQAGTFSIPDPPPNEVVVKPKPGVSINTILTRYNAILLGRLTETNIYFLQLPSGQTTDQILPLLNADSDLYYAEPNYYSDNLPGGGHIMFGGHMAPLGGHIMFGGHGGLTPTPPAGGDQWAWTKIFLTEAQKISRGQGVIVAVLDTGLAPDHPLLNSAITAGYDFVGMTTNIYDTGNNLDDDGNGLTDDFVGHGTHVSGIIVTEAPGVQIMPIRVLNSDGVGTYWEVAAGIKYAVDHGAKIINMSLSAPRLTPSLTDALDYAVSRGVIVVGAAGTGPGPNYPAAYSNSLGVIGVGASDSNDSVPSFSGGRIQDTDVYAPGASIYSAYPYGGYGLGSGTSMAAPIVSGEAALLVSRYPDWSATQVVQRILSKTDPVPGRTVGRVHLSKALNTGLDVGYSVGDFGSPNDNHLKPRIRLVNHTPEDIPLNQLKVRYWYTIDSDQSQSFNCDNTSIPIGCGGLTSAFVRLPSNSVNKTPVSDTYLEVGFSTNAGALAAGGQLDMYLRVNKTNWSNYAETNDYSFDGNKTVTARWDHITLYRNGSLIWGVEPSGGQGGATATSNPATSTPSRTATSIAATATPSRTATQTAIQPTPTRTPTRTATPTRTRTPTPLSVTNTATRTPTPTALPPTATRTATPVPSTPTASSAITVKVQYMPGTTAASSQAISPNFILVNTGSASVPLNELKVRYWYTREGNQPQNYWCDFAAFGCTNLSAQFVALPTPRPGADYHFEISFASGAGSLAPGANTNQIQLRFSKSDWSYYTQTGDYSFDSSRTQFSDWNRMTIYRNGALIWGIEP